MQNKNKSLVSFIYFDLGGVLIRDFSTSNKWQEMKKVMGVKKEFEEEFDKLYTDYELRDLCLSRHVDTLMPIFEDKFKMKFPDNFSMFRYFIDHFEKNVSLLSLARKARKRRKMGLITNIYLGMFEAIVEKGLLSVQDWDVVIDSTKVKLQKPDPQIFALAEKRSRTQHNEILFVDNNKTNIDSAARFGWQTFLYDSSQPETSTRKLEEYLFD